MIQLTLKEWTELHPGALLDGLVFHIPKKHRENVPFAKMALRSVWSMGDGKIGLWMQIPNLFPGGRTYPVFDIHVEDQLMTWKVEERR